METKEEFMSCVKKDAKTGCWNWIGSIHKSTRYARLRWHGKDTHGHRVSYELFNGEIPKGLQIDHLCRNRQCVNPEHLEAVTRYENIIRGEWGAGVNKRKTHCKHGHEFNKSNTGRSKKGRYCKACTAIRSRHTWRKKFMKGFDPTTPQDWTLPKSRGHRK